MSYAPFKKTIIINEKSMTVYSIGWLALILKCHRGSLRRLETQGILPKPLLGEQIDQFYRYYTPAELIGYSQIMQSVRRLPGCAYPPELKQRLHDFRNELRKHLMGGKDLVLNLPNEQQLEAALKNNDDRRQKRIANILLRAQSVR